ncbi:hypothetical protein CBM2634_B50039 [Cupriavidus taiwanensis]|uniref:Uncharacterized protein n=1 Tax=Cupriavidus taiwanensis TaxID=164546 RepID=A0A375J9K8_9BURK|nr:hypothetical protein CBM2634_B50039 [Cupriavidus taiwanensis]
MVAEVPNVLVVNNTLPVKAVLLDLSRTGLRQWAIYDPHRAFVMGQAMLWCCLTGSTSSGPQIA